VTLQLLNSSSTHETSLPRNQAIGVGSGLERLNSQLRCHQHAVSFVRGLSQRPGTEVPLEIGRDAGWSNSPAFNSCCLFATAVKQQAKETDQCREPFHR